MKRNNSLNNSIFNTSISTINSGTKSKRSSNFRNKIIDLNNSQILINNSQKESPDNNLINKSINKDKNKIKLQKYLTNKKIKFYSKKNS